MGYLNSDVNCVWGVVVEKLAIRGKCKELAGVQLASFASLTNEIEHDWALKTMFFTTT